jgi:3-hydroxybutyryl-CoA dehydratase
MNGYAIPFATAAYALVGRPASLLRWHSTSSALIIEGALKGKPIKLVQPGDGASVAVAITDEKIRTFAQLTGDNNPIHLDDSAARERKLEKRIAHGMLVASAIPSLFANCFPLCVYRSQELQFVSPVYVDDLVRTTITVVSLTPIEKRGLVVTKCDTRCQVQRRNEWTDVIRGVAEVIVPL